MPIGPVCIRHIHIRYDIHTTHTKLVRRTRKQTKINKCIGGGFVYVCVFVRVCTARLQHDERE